MEAIRTFIAVPVGTAARQQLLRVQDRLKAAGANVKWVEAANLHLTLHFLGDTNPAQVAAVGNAIRKAVAGVSAFPLAYGGLGAFPSRQNPRVVWAGVTAGQNDLVSLQQSIGAALGAFAPAKARFVPHLTLGRVHSEAGTAGLTKLLADPALATAIPDRAEAVLFLRSDLTRTGPLYTPLRRYPLTGSIAAEEE